MAQSETGRGAANETISRGGYRLVALWAAGILLLYALSAWAGVRLLRGYRAETDRQRRTVIESATLDSESRPSGADVSPEATPADVLVGIYINGLREFSLRESAWTADFDIWFRWTGGGIQPGDSFQVVNGQIEHKEKRESYTRGAEHYERFHVKARLAKFIDPSRFPFADDALSIQIEDGASRAEVLRYIADERSSGISAQGMPPGLKAAERLTMVKRYNHGTDHGDARLSGPDVRSRFIFAMLVSPPSAELYLKLFQALFVSVAIAFLAFFIRPIHVDPRFGLGIGAVFAAVANNIYVGSILPAAGGITLTVLVNAIGLGTIFLTLVQSTISLYIEDTMGRENLRRLFDKVSIAVFLAGYAAVNVALPLAAR